jgi:hypothetical protein
MPLYKQKIFYRIKTEISADNIPVPAGGEQINFGGQSNGL